jgi:tetratricopeptide (TPR) repeat protein
MNWKKLGWGLLAGMLCTPAMALESGAITDAEYASLPPLCKVRLTAGMGSPEYIAWGQSLGKDFMHTHHYCTGLNSINRYYRARSALDKGFHLTNAAGDLSYMVGHASPDYSLMPDIYLNRALVYSLMKQHGKAVTDLTKAIKLDPRLAKAYNMLADYYSGTNQKSKALETVTEGLRHNPGTKSLQRRYTELGGKLPYPDPIQPAPVDAAQAVVSPEKTEAPSASEKTANDAPASAPVEPAEPVPQSKLGTPKNPYCRFCPE